MEIEDVAQEGIQSRDSPSLLIIVVADSTLWIVSTLFPADQMSFDDLDPLDIFRHLLNERLFRSHLVLCFSLPERRVLTIQEFSLL